MEMRYKTYQEYEKLDRYRDHFRQAVPEPASRLALLRRFTRVCLEPAERALAPLQPADDRVPPVSLETALGESLDDLFNLVASGGGLGVPEIGLISRRWNGEPAFRQEEAQDLLDRVPAESPAALAGLLANSLEWFGVDSVLRMHPLEKCSLLTIRLVDLRPFPAWNFYLVRLVPWLFLVQADFPPPLLEESDVSAWREAVGRGRRLETQALAELHRQAVERAWDSLFLLGFEHLPEVQL